MKRTINILFVILVSFSFEGCIFLIPFIEPEDKSDLEYTLSRYSGASAISAQSLATPPNTSNYNTLSNATHLKSKTRLSIAARRKEILFSRLLKDIKSNNPAVRSYAASALGDFSYKREQAIRPLVQSLNDNNKWVRRTAAKSLGSFGRNAVSAVPALIKTLRDRDAYVSHSAANALRKISSREAMAALRSYRSRV